MTKFFVITVRWVATPMHPPLVDGILGLYGDWLRFTGDNWILYSQAETPVEVADHIRKVLQPNDSVMAFEVVPSSVWGIAPHWMWNWITVRLSGAAPGTIPLPQIPEI